MVTNFRSAGMGGFYGMGESSANGSPTGGEQIRRQTVRRQPSAVRGDFDILHFARGAYSGTSRNVVGCGNVARNYRSGRPIEPGFEVNGHDC